MFIRAPPWLCLLSLLLYLPHLVAGRWTQNSAWIRKYRCEGRPWANLQTTPLSVNAMRGQLGSANGSMQFSLSVLVLYNPTQFSCNELDSASLERSLPLKTLGSQTGQVTRFQSTCPLPITPDLNPQPGYRVFSFDVEYQLEHGHKLQTLTAEYEFRTTAGRQLECAAAKITPYIGTAYIVVFTLVPAGVMALVGAAAWQTHAAELGVDHFVDFSSALVSHQGPVWETIMDMGVYLRHLQFVFLSSSLSIEYPGFFQPVTSNAAWSSLMFWRGPYDGGLTWPGTEQGVYVSNGTFGMNHMTMVLGYPRIMDFMFDAFLNLAVLIVALIVILCVVHWLASRSNPRPSALSGIHTRKLAYMSVEVCLSLFSFPLISYMSNDLMLMGYLPNYRVGLIALTMLILLYVHFIITRPFLRSRRRIGLSNDAQSTSRQSFNLSRAFQTFLSYMPHFMPLLQAVAVGALQSWGVVQVIVLFVAEIAILMHTTMAKNVLFRFSRLQTALLSASRLITISILIPMALLEGEAMRQRIGYAILCLHGVVILVGFPATSIRRLYLIKVLHRKLSSRRQGDEPIDTESHINLHDLDGTFATRDRAYNRSSGGKRPCQGPSSTQICSRRASPGEPHCHHQVHRDSHSIAAPATVQHADERREFYRKPRSRLTHLETWHSSSSPSPVSSSGGINTTSSSMHSPASESEQELYPPPRSTQAPLRELGVLPEIRPQADYSFREADLFYGMPVEDALAQDAQDLAGAGRESWTEAEPESRSRKGTGRGKERTKETQTWRNGLSIAWARVSSSLVRPEPKETGFQVVRPGSAALRMARMQQAQARARAQAESHAQAQAQTQEQA